MGCSGLHWRCWARCSWRRAGGGGSVVSLLAAFFFAFYAGSFVALPAHVRGGFLPRAEMSTQNSALFVVDRSGHHNTRPWCSRRTGRGGSYIVLASPTYSCRDVDSFSLVSQRDPPVLGALSASIHVPSVVSAGVLVFSYCRLAVYVHIFASIYWCVDVGLVPSCLPANIPYLFLRSLSTSTRTPCSRRRRLKAPATASGRSRMRGESVKRRNSIVCLGCR